jgi:hypothetical protein
MTVQDYLYIEQNYERRAWGLRQVIETKMRRRASPAPSQIVEMFGMIDEKGLFNRIDALRQTGRGESEEDLGRIVKRRNLIAHTGDRKGRGRASITIAEVESDLACVVSIVDALDRETSR